MEENKELNEEVLDEVTGGVEIPLLGSGKEPFSNIVGHVDIIAAPARAGLAAKPAVEKKLVATKDY